MTKRFLAVVLLLVMAGLAGVMAGCGGGLPSDAVAKVGDALITQDVFDSRVTEFAAQYSIPGKEEDPEGWKAFESDVLDYLITHEMVVQKAEEFGLAVTDEEVQTEITNIITNYYDGDEAKFNEELASYDMSVDKLKSSYRESMLMQKVYDKITAEVTTVPEEDIAAYYEENKDYYFVDETRATRHILIIPGGETINSTTTTAAPGSSASTSSTASTTTTTGAPTDADWADALAIASEVRTKLAAGGDWNELAAKYSDDPGSCTSGGDLGTVAKGEMVAEFEAAVFSLAVDEISEPVKTTYGYHIIQVTGVNEAKQYSVDEVKEDITENLLEKLQTEAWDKWVQDTKAELGVTYREGMEPATSTTLETTDTTIGGTDTTVGGGTTTTAAGETITTEAVTTTIAK
ncbi:MAG: peptidylprolyl isomerase [Thermoleophilia bacterium]|nr:peptidylprolyl isomerase [Thermoleophilia bacterium]